MDYLEQARSIFKNDIFATEVSGIIIDAADVNYAKCSMHLDRRHMNAANTVMGGAIFTLADFTFAIAANMGNPQTVSLTSQISYLGVAKGSSLISEAHCVKSGRNTCFFTVDISDDLGNKVAEVSMTGFRKVSSGSVSVK